MKLEQLQNDIICCIEADNEIMQRFPDLLDNLCQIVVDRVNEIDKTDDLVLKSRAWDTLYSRLLPDQFNEDTEADYEDRERMDSIIKEITDENDR